MLSYARPGQPLTQHIPGKKTAPRVGEHWFQLSAGEGDVLGFSMFLQVCSRED